MAIDLAQMARAMQGRSHVMRVVVAAVRGSAPREVGAAMLIWDSGQMGTIGGGALEFAAAEAARAGQTGLSHHPLGPALGQCCGGAVTLLTERIERAALDALTGPVHARPVRDGAAMPLAVKRMLTQARAQGQMPPAQLCDGWMVEPVESPQQPLWIWGAGHVGRALVSVLAPLPQLAVSWIDTEAARFPDRVPDGVDVVPAARPADLVRHAPVSAAHLIVTYSHALDLELCNQLLLHDFSFAGLIGSDTKRARFHSRLRALGHAQGQIDRITCPIGTPAFGKHPQQIAIGVAAQLLHPVAQAQSGKEQHA